jgi:hypothetical protein
MAQHVALSAERVRGTKNDKAVRGFALRYRSCRLRLT